jgi:hypothetical protein
MRFLDREWLRVVLLNGERIVTILISNQPVIALVVVACLIGIGAELVREARFEPEALRNIFRIFFLIDSGPFGK